MDRISIITASIAILESEYLCLEAISRRFGWIHNSIVPDPACAILLEHHFSHPLSRRIELSSEHKYSDFKCVAEFV